MIQEHVGDLLRVPNGIIVHGCNAKGVMGSGVAKQIRATWPGCYAVYRKEYERAGLKVGDVIFYKVHDHLLIANAITQETFGRNPNVVYVDYDGVRSCFEKIAVMARWKELPVHFPLIGCGLANGSWDVVSQIIDDAVPDPIEKHLWVPSEPPPAAASAKLQLEQTAA
jgi:Predicted phosphatase homologous to the C-terminal domain of histone macroH2A1